MAFSPTSFLLKVEAFRVEDSIDEENVERFLRRVFTFLRTVPRFTLLQKSKKVMHRSGFRFSKQIRMTKIQMTETKKNTNVPGKIKSI